MRHLSFARTSLAVGSMKSTMFWKCEHRKRKKKNTCTIFISTIFSFYINFWKGIVCFIAYQIFGSKAVFKKMKKNKSRKDLPKKKKKISSWYPHPPSAVWNDTGRDFISPPGFANFRSSYVPFPKLPFEFFRPLGAFAGGQGPDFRGRKYPWPFVYFFFPWFQISLIDVTLRQINK